MKSKRIYLNESWSYKASPNNLIESVDLPHSNQLFPHNYLQNHSYEKIVTYEKEFSVTNTDCDVFLVFESILHHAKIYINDQYVYEQTGGYLSFEIPVLNSLPTNTIKVILDSHEQSNIPPFGGVIDYLTYGGINGHVYLEMRPKIRLEKAWFYVDENMNGFFQANLIGINAVNLTLTLEGQMYSCEYKNGDVVSIPVKHLSYWHPDHPTLYPLSILLTSNEETCFEDVLTIGIRHTIFKEDGFYINGEKLPLVGLNRHQSFPVVGYAVPDALDQDDVRILKDFGCNIVRTAHYPQSQAFIDKCDELGILVFTEIPGWQHISHSSAWRQTTLINTKEMVLQYRHHPSIIIWGVRINESQDDDALYSLTNDIAHEYDPSRQTTGVRFIKHSHLLEDVYAFNDFSHTGDNAGMLNPSTVTKSKAPYILSEHNGHMFPTKRFDNEQHRASHALRHARVISDALLNERVSAVIGWVMNDYHTHQDFGSGDMMCYHGVLDLYRVPKLASYVYQSQQEKTIVLQSSSMMNMGDYPGSSISPLFVLTNCDYVELTKNNELIHRFYPSKEYPGLKHPPIFIDDFFGDQLITKEGYTKKQSDQIKEVLLSVYRYGQDQLPLQKKAIMAKLLLSKVIDFEKGFELYTKYIGNWGNESSHYVLQGYKDGQLVKTCSLEPVKKQLLKAVWTHHPLVEINTYDMSLLQVTVVDQNNHILNYCFDVVQIECPKGVEVVGDSVTSFKGGSVGFMIKTKHIEVDDSIILKTSFDTLSIPIVVKLKRP